MVKKVTLIIKLPFWKPKRRRLILFKHASELSKVVFFQMHTKVALGSPYLALDIPEIEELKLTPRLTLNRSKKSEQYVKKINGLLQRAAHLNEIFSSPEPSSSRSKSNKSSVVEMPY